MVLISDGFILQLTEGKGALSYISAGGFRDYKLIPSIRMLLPNGAIIILVYSDSFQL